MSSNVYPFYQIEFNAVAAGKTIAMSKRHIRWRFGFPNREAIESGKTGTECRGVEHEVTVVWSVTSGKRRIMSNNQEIHQSIVRSGALEYSWVMTGNHVVKVVAHSTTSNYSCGKQYDLFVDGYSFFSMPKVFELGLKGMNTPIVPQRATPNRSYSEGPIRAPTNAQEENQDLAKAIASSLEESRRKPPPTQAISVPTINARPSTAPASNETNLIDFLDETPPVQNALVQNHGAIVPTGTPTTQWSQNVAAPPQHPSTNLAPYRPQLQPGQNYQRPVSRGDAVSLPGGVLAQDFTPQAPTYNDISNQIMQSYSQTSAPQQSSMAPQNPSAGQLVPAQAAVVGSATDSNTKGLPPRYGSNNMLPYNSQQQSNPSNFNNYTGQPPN